MILRQPWPEPFRVNARSPYGPRRHPITGRQSFHHGVDVSMPIGTVLTAPADGVVVHKNKTASAGFNLILRHEGTWHTVYYHLERPSHLEVGERVSTGDNIAFSGNTGASTGPHLHWELRRTRAWGDTVNPMNYVQNTSPPPGQDRPEIPVTGRPNHQTWMAFQTELRKHGYNGSIDGIPGRLTISAIQRWANTLVSGVLDRMTRIAVQRKLGVAVDGIWGVQTWSAIQRLINAGGF